MTYYQMTTLMIKEYNSDARELSVRSLLGIIQLERTIAENDTTDSSIGLTKVVDIINLLVTQCPQKFRSK